MLLEINGVGNIDFVGIQNFVLTGISFVAFLVTCGALIEVRATKKTSAIVALAFLLGIVAFQAGMLLSGKDQTLVLTLLPVSAYLPAIVCVHMLSKSKFFLTVAVWALGVLVVYILLFLQKALVYFSLFEGIPGDLFVAACLAAVACLLLFVVIRVIRTPFRQMVLHATGNWLLLCFPVLMIFLLLSYYANSTVNFTLWTLIFLTSLSVFIIVARVLTSAAAASQLQEARNDAVAQLDIQRHEYEALSNKVEAGRAYRHDMRHHLATLSVLAKDENSDEIVRYLHELDIKMQEVEQETYCENATVNAVLSFYVRKAKEAGCVVVAKVDIPAETSFDTLDICTVLANALENAILACQHRPEVDSRCIELSACIENKGKLVVFTKNPCERSLAFDEEGLPAASRGAEQGIGLKSIKAIVDKYQGLFQCACEEGVFNLRVLLFDGSSVAVELMEKRGTGRRFGQGAAVALAMPVAFCALLGCVVVSEVARSTPSPSSALAAQDVSPHDFRWGSTALRIEMPEVVLADASADEAQEGEVAQDSTSDPATPPTPSSPSGSASWESSNNASSDPFATPPPVVVVPPPEPSPEVPNPPDLSDGVDDINKKMEEYVTTLREKFLWYVARKYNGSVGMDTVYTTLRNDDELLSIRFVTTLNAGGSGEYSRCFSLDKRTGEVLELADIFAEGVNYVEVLSSEILRQMALQVNAGQADYFIPGGIWSDAECFKAIAPDQNFYLNEHDQLVIVFDEYEVAPGSAGMPEFVIPADVLEGIVPQPSVLCSSQEQ